MRRLILGILFAASLLPSGCLGQSRPDQEAGTKPYGSYAAGDIDQVNMMNGNLTVRIPLYSLSQRGKLGLSFSLVWNENHFAYFASCSQNSTSCSYAYSAGLPGIQAVWDQEIDFNYRSVVTPGYNSSTYNLIGVVTDNADGSTHTVGNDQADTSFRTLRATDGSGYAVITPTSFNANNANPEQGTVYTSQGIQYQQIWQNTNSVPTQTGMNVVDPDGNVITAQNPEGIYSATPQLTDTIGRVIPNIAGLILSGSMASSTAGCPVVSASNQPLVGSITWNLPGYSKPYLFCFATVSVRTNYFGLPSGQTSACSGSYPNSQTCYREAVQSLPAIQSVVLPDGTFWAFTYDSADPTAPSTSIAYGDLLSITTPTGGRLSYLHGIATNPCANTSFDGYKRAVGSRSVQAGDGNTFTTQYKYGNVTAPNGIASLTNTLMQADGNDVVYKYTGLTVGGFECASFEASRTTFQGHQSGNQPLKTVATTYYASADPQGLGFYGSGQIGVLPKTIVTTLYEAGASTASNVSTQSFQYDAGFTDVENGCDVGPSSTTCGTYAPNNAGLTATVPFGKQISSSTSSWNSTTAQQTTTTAYEWQTSVAYKTANLLDLPSSITITGPGTPGSSSVFTYDEPSYLSASGLGGSQRLLAAPNGATRGHLTTVTRGVDSSSTISFHTAWWDSGEKYQDIDGKGNTASTYQYSGTYLGAYPTTIINALGQATALTYYQFTGQVASSTDSNSNTTSYSFDDMRRLTDVVYPDVQGAVHAETKYLYNGGTPSTVTSQRTLSSALTLIPQEEWDFDGLGRLVHHRLLSDSDGTDVVDTTYDAMGRVYSVSNPYRSTTDPSYGLTTYLYDALGRQTVATHVSDGNVQRHTYSGNSVDTYDEASNHSRYSIDSLGRLTQAFEPDTSNTPLIETDYAYDALGNLLLVTQNGLTSEVPRHRSFTYDSLSRLICSSNPEASTTSCPAAGSSIPAGVVSYSYDLNSNVVGQTDATGMTVTTGYDALNRVTSVSAPDYADTFLYMIYDKGSNGIGRLYEAGNSYNGSPLYDGIVKGAGGTRFSYDLGGRVNGTTRFSYALDKWQPGMSMLYDLGGRRTQVTYPDTRTLYQRWDNADRLKSVTDVTAGGSGTIYFGGSSNQAAYWPSGVLMSSQFGSGVTQSFLLNNRLQLCHSTASTPVLMAKTGSGNLLDRQLFHNPTLSSPCGSEIANNGNIYANVDNIQTGWKQTYNYDYLNRLKSVARSDGLYSYTYSYDSFGNMLPHDLLHSNLNYSIDPATNRLLLNNTDLQYDFAGRLSSTPNPLGGSHVLAYTGQGLLRSIDNYQTGSYLYNGLNERVFAVHNSTSWTDYTYLDGQPMAELTSDGEWKDYIYANGSKIAAVASQQPMLHLRGTRANNFSCGWGGPINGVSGALSGYTVQNGDRLVVSMKQNQFTDGGLALIFTNQDASGDNGTGSLKDVASGQQLINNPNIDGLWHAFVGDLSPYQGRTVSYALAAIHADAANGTFDLQMADAAIVTASGSTIPILNGSQSVPAFSGTSCGASNMSGSSELTVFSGLDGLPSTRYYLDDQVGTVQMEVSAGGWPLWQGQFTPFGQEIVNGVTRLALGPEAADGTQMNYKFTGKERDTESGLDYFGARYYGSSMGRMMSPDPLMASAKAWDPQTWNRYAYARNNPLTYIDPTGMAEVNAAACAKDKACVTVNVNVIYDKNANGGSGVSDSQKASFEKNQLQNAKDQYGNADIHLNVTYTAGEINDKGNLTGVAKGSLNVFVTDSGGPASASSGGYALSRINVNSSNHDDLSHEMAHHFMGDMSSALGRTLSKDPTGISRIIDNMFTDVTNDTGRLIMNNVTPHLPNYPSGAPMSIFNPQAREFQKSITPQTHP